MLCLISRILARDRKYVWEGNSKVVKEVGKTLYVNFERSNKIESERGNWWEMRSGWTN